MLTYPFWTQEENILFQENNNFWYIIFNMTCIEPFKILTDQCCIESTLFEFTKDFNLITQPYLNGKKVLIKIQNISQYIIIIEDKEGFYYGGECDTEEETFELLNLFKLRRKNFVFIVVNLANFSPSFINGGTIVSRSGDIQIYY